MLVDAPLLAGSSASGALPSAGTTLVGSPGGLEVLGADGTRLRGWGWPGIVGWDADGTASGGEGRVRQLLTVRTRSGPLAVLADAGQLGELLATMAGLAGAFGARPRRGGRTCRTAGAGRRIGVAVASTVLAGSVAAAAPAFLARPASEAARARHARKGVLAVPPALAETTVHLAKATAAPAPAPASLGAAPLAAHEAFGFLPYWALEDPASVDLSSLTTIAYFSVDLNPPHG